MGKCVRFGALALIAILVSSAAAQAQRATALRPNAATAPKVFAPRTPKGIGGLSGGGSDVGTIRIVNGIPADIEEHPWQVALIITLISGEQQLCGGSVIAARWVLTAAHCFLAGVDARASEARSGSADLFEGGDLLRVETAIPHPEFRLGGYRNDIALVKVRGDLSDRVIPLIGRGDTIDLGTTLEVTGWGATGEGEPISTHLLKAGVPLVSNDECNAPEAYAGQVTSRMLCAGHKEGGTDACQGDSGGPLVWRGPEGPKLAGVVSWGEGCARALRYGVYTRVAIYEGWIADTMAAN